MSKLLSRTAGPKSFAGLAALYNSLCLALAFSVKADPAIGDGTTAGQLRTTAAADFQIGQFVYNKASTDDLWDLSAETDTVAGQYRAYWLLLDSAGAASFVAGTDAASEADALLGLPLHDETKSIAGVFVAGPSTDFSLALVAQGTVYDGVPDGAWVGVGAHPYAAPQLALLNPKP